MVMHNFGIDNKLHERGLLPVNQPITSPADCQSTRCNLQRMKATKNLISNPLNPKSDQHQIFPYSNAL